MKLWSVATVVTTSVGLQADLSTGQKGRGKDVSSSVQCNMDAKKSIVVRGSDEV